MKNIKLSDFGDIALSIKPILVTHEVPEEIHYSIISDIVFNFANFLDEKSGSHFHEDIFGLLDAYDDQLSRPLELDDYLVADLNIRLSNDEVVETNVLKSHLKNREHLMLILEVALDLRDLDEIDVEIDIDERFSKFLKEKGGIKSLEFLPAENGDGDDWHSVELSDSKYGVFEQSLQGIFECIHKVANQWLDN